MKKLYGYMRVSTKEQNEDRQRMRLCEAGIRNGDIFLDKQSGKDFDRKIYRRMLELLDAEEIAAAKMRGAKFGRLRIRLPQIFSEVKTLYDSKSLTLSMPCNIAECAALRFGRRLVDKIESRGNSRVYGQRFPQILLKILLFSARLLIRFIRKCVLFQTRRRHGRKL